jgi:hypothetical protein
VISCSTNQARTPLAAVPGSDLKFNRKGHHMSVQMVQARIKAEKINDVQAATKRMFAALSGAQPEGIRYVSCLAADGETFVALLQVDGGVENPSQVSPNSGSSWNSFEGSRAEPASVEPLTVIGSYGLF